MIKVTDAIKLGAGALVGISIAAFPIYLKGKSAGREETRAEAAIEALDRIEGMEDRNANFSKLSDRERCRVFLRDSGLPVEACDRREWLPDRALLEH